MAYQFLVLCVVAITLCPVYTSQDSSTPKAVHLHHHRHHHRHHHHHQKAQARTVGDDGTSAQRNVEDNVHVHKSEEGVDPATAGASISSAAEDLARILTSSTAERTAPASTPGQPASAKRSNGRQDDSGQHLHNVSFTSHLADKGNGSASNESTAHADHLDLLGGYPPGSNKKLRITKSGREHQKIDQVNQTKSHSAGPDDQSVDTPHEQFSRNFTAADKATAVPVTQVGPENPSDPEATHSGAGEVREEYDEDLGTYAQHLVTQPPDLTQEHDRRSLVEDSHQAKERPSPKLGNRPRWYIRRDEDADGEGTSPIPQWLRNRPRWDKRQDDTEFSSFFATTESGSLADVEDERRHSMGHKDKPRDTPSLEKEVVDRKMTATKKNAAVSKRQQSHRRKFRSWKKRPRPAKKQCVGCSKLEVSITQARELHKQILKAQLLDKLRLVPSFQERPLPPKLPDQLFPDSPQNDQASHEDRYYAKPTQLLVFGRDLGQDRLRKAGTGSYQFELTNKVKGAVTSAHLWVYKMKDARDGHGQTLVVTELHYSKRRRLRERSLVARLDTAVQEGWVRFDVTRLVRRWMTGRTPAALQMLAIRCKTCHTTNYRAVFGVKSNFRPVLVVDEQRDDGGPRDKRSSCDPNTGCCKFELTVHFNDLGVHEIFHPRSIRTGYCYGTCERPDAFHHNHTMIIQRLRYGSHAPLPGALRDRLEPCCVPVVLREASLMHYLNDGLDTQVSIVPNLLVDKCGCA